MFRNRLTKAHLACILMRFSLKMLCAVGRAITEQRIPYNQTFPGFLLNFSSSRETGPTSWHLPPVLPFFSLLPSLLLCGTPQGRAAGVVLGPLKPLGVGAEGPAHSKLDLQTAASIQVFATDIRSLGCPDEQSSLDKLLPLCPQAALGFL